ncbi:MAG: mismatch-specific DNA-glycosylase [Gemmatimonadetes bacterium]|nr:mismatch-specific DNA-glycosylase [Gemmatimonadota bacterium]
MDPNAKLEDLLIPGLDLVVCGSAASSVSAERGQYYAGPGNRFWSVLEDTGLTPRRLQPSEYRSLLEHGIGLTDVVKNQAGVGNGINFPGHGATLEPRIRPYSPRFLCFNGKRAALEALGLRRVSYGLQSTMFGSTRLFVAPSTSAAARRWWDTGLWQQVADLVRWHSDTS